MIALSTPLFQSLPMIFLRHPSPEQIDAFLDGQRAEPFSHPHVGATQGQLPSDWTVDHNRIRLGSGPAAFEAACAALRRWEMFRLGWVEIHGTGPPIVPGLTVGMLARVVGIYWLNACRVVYTVQEDGPVRRFGFAYGTLTDHVERGEERFLIEQLEDGSVWYSLLAFSSPRHPLVRLAYPMTRHLQHRFVAQSLRTMKRAVETAESRS